MAAERRLRIFIHHDGALGDMLLSVPCIASIRESAAYLHISGRMDVVQFIKEAGLADEVSPSDSRRYSSLYTELADEDITVYLSGFERSYIFTANAGSQLLQSIRSIIPDTRPILTIPPECSREHAAAFRLRQFSDRDEAMYQKSAIVIPDAEKIWADAFLKESCHAVDGDRIVIIHPGSGGKIKCWPPEKFAVLIDWFKRDPRNLCIVITGPAEDLAALSHQLSYGGRVISLHHEALMRVAALLSLSDYYVGNDSGISHLAGIMNCRGTVLFGPTDPSVWRPQGAVLRVVHFIGAANKPLSEIIAHFKSTIAVGEGEDILL